MHYVGQLLVARVRGLPAGYRGGLPRHPPRRERERPDKRVDDPVTSEQASEQTRTKRDANSLGDRGRGGKAARNPKEWIIQYGSKINGGRGGRAALL